MLIYDIEIVNAIPPKDPADRIAGIVYCKGWHDFEGMGIAVIGAYDSVEDAFRVFCRDNFTDFWGLAMDQDLLVGFNNIGFDNRLLATLGFDFDRLPCFDLMRAVWDGAGLAPTYDAGTHKGLSLDNLARANTGYCKSGDGAMAPVNWQQGHVGTVVDYCLTDVWLTRELVSKAFTRGYLMDPRKKGHAIPIRRPDGLFS